MQVNFNSGLNTVRSFINNQIQNFSSLPMKQRNAVIVLTAAVGAVALAVLLKMTFNAICNSLNSRVISETKNNDENIENVSDYDSRMEIEEEGEVETEEKAVAKTEKEGEVEAEKAPKLGDGAGVGFSDSDDDSGLNPLSSDESRDSVNLENKEEINKDEVSDSEFEKTEKDDEDEYATAEDKEPEKEVIENNTPPPDFNAFFCNKLNMN